MNLGFANIDLDGVCFNFDAALADYIGHRLHRRLPPPDVWAAWEAWGLDEDQFYRLFMEAVEDGIFRGFAENKDAFVIPGALEGVAALRELGWSIRFISHKLYSNGWVGHHDAFATRDALTWMSETGFLDYADGVVFVRGRNGAFDKTEYPATLVVDDKPNPDEWAQRGALNILYPQPYNGGGGWIGHPLGVVRLTGWPHIIEIATLVAVEHAERLEEQDA